MNISTFKELFPVMCLLVLPIPTTWRVEMSRHSDNFWSLFSFLNHNIKFNQTFKTNFKLSIISGEISILLVVFYVWCLGVMFSKKPKPGPHLCYMPNYWPLNIKYLNFRGILNLKTFEESGEFYTSKSVGIKLYTVEFIHWGISYLDF